MKNTYNRACSFSEAKEYDINQQISMNYEQRQSIVLALKKKVFGKNIKDVRDCPGK